MNIIYYSVVILGLLVPYNQAAGHGGTEETVCSEENLEATAESFQTCLSKIEEIFTDTSRFYFGTGYQAICRPDDFFSIPCFLPATLLARNYSIQDVLFPAQEPALNLVAYISLLFHLEKGDSYSGCDTTVTIDEHEHFHIDPASDEVYEPFSLNHSPDYTMYVAPGESIDTSSTYTIIIQDVGNYYFHMVHTNVMFNSDSSVAQQTPVKPYHGPLNSREVPQPYAVMVFQQQAEISVSQEWAIVLSNLAGVNSSLLQGFIADYSLQGPVALSWLLASYDPYSVQIQKDLGIIENCAPFVEEELRDQSRPWLSQILPDESSLSVFISTDVRSDSFSFEFCCETYTTGEETITLDPLSNAMFETVKLRVGVDAMFKVSANQLFPGPDDFTGQRFAMLAVDPDLPELADYAFVGSNERPLAHMIAVNIIVNEMGMLEFPDEGIVADWVGPAPPDDSPHTYYFLLMEQEDGELEVTVDDLLEKGIVTECLPVFRGRCRFDIPGFATEYNLNLVGATWFRAENDPHANYFLGVTSGCRVNAQQGECELYHVDKMLREHDQQWVHEILSDEDELSVGLDISIDTLESLSYKFCCYWYIVEREQFDVDPLEDTIYDTALVRTGSKLHYTVSSRDDLTGKLFTIINVDPDIPSIYNFIGDKDRPFIHMLAVNGHVSTEEGQYYLEDFDYLTSWNGPAPPNIENPTHRYYFLLMEQESEISVENQDLANLDVVDANCPPTLPGRCRIDLAALASTYNMKLVGASWFRSENDPFVDFRNEEYETCDPSRRDPDNCPGTVSSANKSKLPGGMVMLITFLSFLKM